RTRFVASAVLAGLIAMSIGAASGQNFPNRPVRIITLAVGSASDFVARFLAERLTSNLGQPVIVENQTNFAIMASTVAKAPPDGYTLLGYGSPIWVVPLVQKMPYDSVTDFVPVALTGRSVNVLVVHPSLPARSVKELIALAKAKPGELNYA